MDKGVCDKCDEKLEAEGWSRCLPVSDLRCILRHTCPCCDVYAVESIVIFCPGSFIELFIVYT